METTLPWIILLSPLASAVLILLFAHRSKSLSVALSLAAVSTAFGATLLLASSGAVVQTAATWVDLGPALHLTIGIKVDALTRVMLLVVTGIGALVHVYSTVYMAEDAGKSRFFGALSLFMFSMLGIVLADNLAMMFIFWELVGVSSFLLIGHWFTKESAAKAANKAFLTNRIGDFGFMSGILLVWAATGSVDFGGIQQNLGKLTSDPTLLTLAGLCLFCGAVGKSAQVPLHVWLPDAMEGPTPVSALIHAATMVAAGVYMLARIFFILEPSPVALAVIAGIGATTAVLAALMATQQDDVKRILAYSTLSQLGLMVAGVGVGAWGASMFHLFTHAFFKALLFLGSGAVIHALHHEQDIWKMGGLRKTMPKTFLTFAIGTLALTGAPYLAGFFSKDAILLAAWHKTTLVFCAALFTSLLTAFYMTRLVVVAFLGEARTPAAKHGHDCPAAMTVPLLILALLSVIAGYEFFAGSIFGTELFHSVHAAEHVSLVPILAVGAFLLGTGAAWALYAGKVKDPVRIPLFGNRFYIDEMYAALIAGTQDLLASFSGWFDHFILDGVFVRGLSGLTWGVGYTLRLLQIGNLQGYAFLFGAGVVALFYMLIK
ncbi:MAG: NADH-quinone oxidoreductase subunit L [Verrucomicrobia bacterium]|nr:MAG: NADH-quinone oxidoreductase subunit L [Verrucomicrobiota bacterium]